MPGTCACSGAKRLGYLASTVDDYAAAIVDILNTYDRDRARLTAIQQRARKHATLFSRECFEKQLHASLIPQLAQRLPSA